MTEQEFDRLGEQITMTIAGAIMKGVVAGAAKLSQKMTELARDSERGAEDAEADKLTELAEHIERQREDLRRQIAEAKGLKRVALERRLKQLDDAEARMVVELMGQEEPKAIAGVPEAVRSRTILLEEATQPRRNGKRH